MSENDCDLHSRLTPPTTGLKKADGRERVIMPRSAGYRRLHDVALRRRQSVAKKLWRESGKPKTMTGAGGDGGFQELGLVIVAGGARVHRGLLRIGSGLVRGWCLGWPSGCCVTDGRCW